MKHSTLALAAILAAGCSPAEKAQTAQQSTPVPSPFLNMVGTYSSPEAYNVYMVGLDGKGYRATLAPAGGVLGDAGYVAFQLDANGRAYDGSSTFVCSGNTLHVTRPDGSTVTFTNNP